MGGPGGRSEPRGLAAGGSAAEEDAPVAEAPRGLVVAGEPVDAPVPELLAELAGLARRPVGVLAALVLEAGDGLQNDDRIRYAGEAAEAVRRLGASPLAV